MAVVVPWAVLRLSAPRGEMDRHYRRREQYPLIFEIVDLQRQLIEPRGQREAGCAGT